MADDEQFSLCWNNFNTNLSAGFHESLCRGDLVDVTLAAEGQLVKAHRLVLSVCSPYFRKMFTQMPANQHAFVFLKDVSHSALKDLIQFMYCGEVNVKQDALPAFISTAEALQIKGLTENGDGPSGQAPHPSPAKESTVVHSTPAPPPTGVSPRGGGGGHKIVQRARVQSYKIESEESSDEKAQTVHVQPTPVAQKRTMARTVTPASTPVLKRAKITTTADPLEASEPTVQTIQIVKNVPSSEPEYVEMPIETINPKSEPEYVEDSAVMEGTEQEHDETETHEIHETEEGQYVEDESYGDMKYDESYFTEGDDTKAGASGFGESYAEGADQSASEAQDVYHELATMRRKLKSLIALRHSDIYDTTKFHTDYGLPISTKEALEKLETDYKMHKEVRETYIDYLRGIRKTNVFDTLKCIIDPAFVESMTYNGHSSAGQGIRKIAAKDCDVFTTCFNHVFPRMTDEEIHGELKLFIKRCLKKTYNAKYRKKDEKN